MKVISAAITFPNVQVKATSFSFHNEIFKTAFKVIENELENCCQNEQNLVTDLTQANLERPQTSLCCDCKQNRLHPEMPLPYFDFQLL